MDRMRAIWYEAESLRIEAGRAQVFAALVEAERARSAEIRAERHRHWLGRVMWAFLDCRPPRQRLF